MFLAIALNLASAAVLVGGWSLAVWTLYKRLGSQSAPAAQLYARRLPETDRLRDAVLFGERAAWPVRQPGAGPGPGGRPVLHNDALAVPTTARRILVIEDEPGIRSFASRALSTAGFAVGEAADGREGLRIARPDFVLLDLGLPDLAGEEVLRCLRQERPEQTVLVWSATADRDAERRCLLLGARACLRKPVPIAELLRSIGAPGRPTAPSVRLRAGLIQRQGNGMTPAGGSRPDFHARQGAPSAIPRTDGRCLRDPRAPHPCTPPVRGRGAARRFLLSPSRRVRVQHRELNVWHRAGGSAS